MILAADELPPPFVVVVDGVDDECSCGCLDEAELDLNFDESELNNPPFAI